MNESIQEFEDDEWLEKSLEKSERCDPDFDPSCEMEDLELKLRYPQQFNFKSDRVLLVYESKLQELLKRCRKCGSVITESSEMKGDGSQYRVKMECLDGCDSMWCSQPVLSAVAG